jgi:hypothetical protein
LTKRASKIIDHDINKDLTTLQLIKDKSSSDSKVSENDTNEFLLTEVDKIIENDHTINKNDKFNIFNKKLKLNDIQENLN